MIEQQLFPRLFQPGLGAGTSCQPLSQQGELLRLHQGVFRLAVGPLHGRTGSVAAAGVVQQAAPHHGELLGQGRVCHVLEVVLGAGKGHVRLVSYHLLQYGQAPDGGTAAVVAHTVEVHVGDGVFLCQLTQLADLPSKGFHPFRSTPEVGVLKFDLVGQYPAAIGCLPPEQIGQLIVFVIARAHEDVGVHAGLFQQLGQHGVVAKGVHMVAHPGLAAQMLLKVPLGVEGVTAESLAGREVAVGLHPHASGNGPAALFHPLADLLEHGGINLLHPLVVAGAGAGEDVVGEFLHPVQSGTVSGEDLRETLAFFPKPHRVDVGVADEINGIHKRILSQGGLGPL